MSMTCSGVAGQHGAGGQRQFNPNACSGSSAAPAAYAAAMASADGDHAGAARMIGFTDRAYAAVAQVPDPDDATDLSRARESAVAALGDDDFAAAYAAGAALDPEQAFGLNWR